MRFRELVLQGVRNFSQTHRLPLGPGLTLFAAGSAGGKSTIAEVVFHLLNPDPTEPGTQKFLGPAGEGVCRAALLIEASDGQLFRLVQDLVRGSLVLARHDAASGQFATISNSPTEIRQYLGSQLRLPHSDVLEGLFFAHPRQLPSLVPPPAPPQVSPPARQAEPVREPARHEGSVGFQGFQGPEPDDLVLPEDPDEIRRQLEVLRRDLALAREVDEVQFELDGLQSELFELQQRSQGVRQAEQKLEQLQGQLASFENLSRLPEDFEKRVREYEQAVARYERDCQRLDEETERWQKRSQAQKPPPLLKQPIFTGGLALGLLSLAVGTAGFFLEEWLRWLALMDIPAFGVALYAALQHIDARESVKRSAKRLELVEQRREKLQREFELATAVVRRLMEEFGVDKPAQILEQYARRNQLAGQVERAQAELEKLRAAPEYQQSQGRQQELEQRIAELERRLEGATGLMMSASEMERRIKLLEKKLAGGGPAPAAPPPAAEADSIFEFGPGAPPGALRQRDARAGPRLPPADYETAGPLTATTAADVDPTAGLLKLAEDVFLVPRERVEQMLETRAAQILAALSGGRFTGMTFSGGGAEVASPTGNLPAATLPAADRDLVYLAVRLTVLELACRQNPVPIILDDPFRQLPAGLRDIMGRALRYLGGLTQVILLSSDTGWAPYCHASFQLG